LKCNQVDCGTGPATTVTGTVFAPNGTLPVYNAIVYVPNADLDPLAKGASCERCGKVSGEPIVSAVTSANGSFTLTNVPTGKNVPLVVQIGKWRRKVTLPEVKSCQENKLTDPELTRLPKKQSEGDMPRIALTTGGCDNIGCLLPKLGIDASELGTAADGASKSVHVYVGSGGQGPTGATSAQSLWTDVTKLKAYDMAILSCECQEALANKGDAAFQAMTDYLKAGGRVFTNDFQYVWLKSSPDVDLHSVATIKGGAPMGTNPIDVDTTFPKGKALNDWLLASFPTAPAGKVACDAVFDNFDGVDATKARLWSTSGTPAHPRVVSVNVPAGLPADQQCGRLTHVDAHLDQNGGDAVGASYPSSCVTPLRAGEGLSAFLFFDLAACIQKDSDAPKAPETK
jgi:hypothetical protein